MVSYGQIRKFNNTAMNHKWCTKHGSKEQINNQKLIDDHYGTKNISNYKNDYKIK